MCFTADCGFSSSQSMSLCYKAPALGSKGTGLDPLAMDEGLWETGKDKDNAALWNVAEAGERQGNIGSVWNSGAGNGANASAAKAASRATHQTLKCSQPSLQAGLSSGQTSKTLTQAQRRPQMSGHPGSAHFGASIHRAKCLDHLSGQFGAEAPGQRA